MHVICVYVYQLCPNNKKGREHVEATVRVDLHGHGEAHLAK